jgi:hypothetical protein
MEMNERAWQFGMKYAREIVGTSEAYKNEDKNEQRHTQEKIIVTMFPNQAACEGCQGSPQSQNGGSPSLT